MHWIAVAIGGALGAMGRYAVSSWVFQINHKFPFATLAINVLGSFVMGILYSCLLSSARLLSMEMRSLLMIGFLGAFTTFSTFSLDALGLWQNGHLFLALLYVLATVGSLPCRHQQLQSGLPRLL